MDLKEVGIVLGVGSALIFILKIVAEKMIGNWVETKRINEELRDSMLHEKINRLTSDMNTLSNEIKTSSGDMTRHKIMIQTLSHQLDSFRSDLKASDAVSKKTSEYLVKILQSMQSQIKSQEEQLKFFGNVLMKIPEGKE